DRRRPPRDGRAGPRRAVPDGGHRDSARRHRGPVQRPPRRPSRPDFLLERLGDPHVSRCGDRRRVRRAGARPPTSGEYSTPTPPFTQYTHMSVVDAAIALNLPYTVDAIDHLILPAVVLAFINMGIATRMTRASMLEVLPLDYVKSARMKGLGEFWVMYKHALRNALITTVTVLGITAGGLLAGTVVIEEVFDWPGIGQYAFTAIGGNGSTPNFDGAIAVVIIFAIAVVVANLVADILYGLLDPRVDWR